jgi:hypothetical protein
MERFSNSCFLSSFFTNPACLLGNCDKLAAEMAKNHAFNPDEEVKLLAAWRTIVANARLGKSQRDFFSARDARPAGIIGLAPWAQYLNASARRRAGLA